jgi:hypothetical protein
MTNVLQDFRGASKVIHRGEFPREEDVQSRYRDFETRRRSFRFNTEHNLRLLFHITDVVWL